MNLVTGRVAIHCLFKLSHRGRVELETMPLNKSLIKFQANYNECIGLFSMCLIMNCGVVLYYLDGYGYFLVIPECFIYYPAFQITPDLDPALDPSRKL
jgi:hypothetical protein